MVPGLETGLWPWFLALDTYPLLPYHHPDTNTWEIDDGNIELMAFKNYVPAKDDGHLPLKPKP